MTSNCIAPSTETERERMGNAEQSDSVELRMKLFYSIVKQRLHINRSIKIYSNLLSFVFGCLLIHHRFVWTLWMKFKFIFQWNEQFSTSVWFLNDNFELIILFLFNYFRNSIKRNKNPTDKLFRFVWHANFIRNEEKKRTSMCRLSLDVLSTSIWRPIFCFDFWFSFFARFGFAFSIVLRISRVTIDTQDLSTWQNWVICMEWMFTKTHLNIPIQLKQESRKKKPLAKWNKKKLQSKLNWRRNKSFLIWYSVRNGRLSLAIDLNKRQEKKCPSICWLVGCFFSLSISVMRALAWVLSFFGYFFLFSTILFFLLFLFSADVSCWMFNIYSCDLPIVSLHSFGSLLFLLLSVQTHVFKVFFTCIFDETLRAIMNRQETFKLWVVFMDAFEIEWYKKVKYNFRLWPFKRQLNG